MRVESEYNESERVAKQDFLRMAEAEEQMKQNHTTTFENKMAKDLDEFELLKAL